MDIYEMKPAGSPLVSFGLQYQEMLSISVVFAGSRRLGLNVVRHNMAMR
jgi:hypothetical protein